MDPTVTATFGLATQLALFLLFFVSGISKLRNLSVFRVAVRRYDIGPPVLTDLVAFGLPPAEILLGVLWLTPIILPMALVTLILLACFVLTTGINMRRGRNIPCGCSGLFESSPIGWGTIVRNILIATIAFVPLLVQRRFSNSHIVPTFAQELTPYGVLLIITTAGFLVIGVVLLDALLNQQIRYTKIHPLVLQMVKEAHNGK